nr:response regulator [uncultured Lichenicoccus sp.]
MSSLAARAGSPGGAPHVLVVDDSAVLRMYYRQILETAGYRVSEAINGLEGLEQALRTSFDLCIVDVNMPMMDGYAMLRELRRDTSTRSIPVLMTSTEAAPHDRSRAIEAGANTYLVKPVPPDRLTGYVAALVGKVQA